MNYAAACNTAVTKLMAAQVPEAKENALLLLEHICGSRRQDLYLDPGRILTQDEEDKYFDLIDKRCARIPLQLLTGTAYFFGLAFKVDGNVLIPRQDTEILVGRVLDDGACGCALLDMCTGSGCIPISIMKHAKLSFAAGCDRSPEALKNAAENAALLKAAVEFYEGDMFEALPEEMKGSFDIITSNPPYIKSGDIAGLMPEVRDHDPYMALDGGADGLIFYRRIADEALSWLKEGGRIYMEIGCDQAGDVSRIFAEKGYKDIEVIKDYAGLDRVIFCRA